MRQRLFFKTCFNDWQNQLLLGTSAESESWSHISWCPRCSLCHLPLPSPGSCDTELRDGGLEENGRQTDTSFNRIEKNLLGAETKHLVPDSSVLLVLYPNVLFRRSNYSDFYFLVNNHICHNWFNWSKTPSWQSWRPEPMCQLCQGGCEQKLHEMEEKEEKEISHSHIDGGDQYVLFSQP